MRDGKLSQAAACCSGMRTTDGDQLVCVRLVSEPEHFAQRFSAANVIISGGPELGALCAKYPQKVIHLFIQVRTSLTLPLPRLSGGDFLSYTFVDSFCNNARGDQPCRIVDMIDKTNHNL